MIDGWIVMHRKIFDWQWYKNHIVKNVFFHLILKANFKEHDFEDIVIKRGEVVTSNRRLQEDLNLSEQQVKTALKKLTKSGEIVKSATNKYTKILIVNYDKYQPFSGIISNQNWSKNSLISTIEESNKEIKEENNNLNNKNIGFFEELKDYNWLEDDE